MTNHNRDLKKNHNNQRLYQVKNYCNIYKGILMSGWIKSICKTIKTFIETFMSVNILNEIVQLLGEQTVGCTDAEKTKYLRNLGYESFSEVRKLTDNDLNHLISRLKDIKNSIEYVTVNNNGIYVTRPKRPTHVNQISFRIGK